MVCTSCRHGGILIQQAHETLRADEREELEYQAAIEHAKCRGETWCDCQHLGFGVNKLAR